jgi:hypothetical protein
MNNAISKLIRLILFTDLSLDIYVYISNNVKALILEKQVCFVSVEMGKHRRSVKKFTCLWNLLTFKKYEYKSEFNFNVLIK